MIDEDRTFQSFGYTSDQLTPRSGKKIVTVCEECGKYGVVRKSRYRELCGSCSRKGEHNPSWKGGNIAKTCEICGKEFSVNHYKQDSARFCSNECRGKWRSENLHGENNPYWKEKVVKICEICGKEFSVSPSLSHLKFCSRECYGKHRSEMMIGENSPLFKKPKSIVSRRKMSATKQGISYDEWEGFAMNSPYCPKFDEACRESNRKKYDRCCFLSGATEEENGRKLSVHHIDMNKNQGCDDHAWKLVPLSMTWHSRVHIPLWMARIQYLLNHVWNPGRDNVIS